MTPEHFINKWKAVTLSERSASHQHFLDLCALIGEPTPAEADPAGDTFTFEKGGTTATGGQGWADVWKKGAFAWEYKGPGKDLNAAYLQLKKYADMLENPPLLITSDTRRIEIHTNFTNTVKVMHTLELTDLGDPAKREMLRSVFVDPERLRPGVTRHQVTTEAASTFSELAHQLQAKGYDPKRVAHFLNRIIFCMFAEDVGLLPNQIFTKLASASVAHPETFEANAKQLFGGMARGGAVAFEVIDWFNGGLFDDDSTLPLDQAELKLVLKCAELDWSNIEPSIFGTLFERGLDPDKRSQQGAHYTDPETIMKIVGPVVLEPWAREWDAEKMLIGKQVDRAKRTISEAAQRRYISFLDRLHQFRVLDPACGSGNFLYLALRGLKDFEKRVIHEAETLGMQQQFPRVGPESVLGIEVNPYAAELARVTIWIGEIQWMIENGFGAAKNPILKPLDQIVCRDAILNENGSEPEWPKVDAIVGNPPFLGGKMMRSGLGDDYVGQLFALYDRRVPAEADLVTYWFEKAAFEIKNNPRLRVGLVATNSIRGGPNRRVLQRVCEVAQISDAWSDEPWINEGASVRVSLIAFAAPASYQCRLDGISVDKISTDLHAVGNSGVDLTYAIKLPENKDICFMGITKVGPFDIDGETARSWILSPNPHGRGNTEVLRPSWNGYDVTRRMRDMWIIDFGVRMSESDAACFEVPFAYAHEHIKPERAKNNRVNYAKSWWLHGETRPTLRGKLQELERAIVTPEVSKHRIFVWLPRGVLPDKNLHVICRDDDTTFGILHSRIHELWALRMCSWLGVGNDPRYTPSTTFETFPFPDSFTPRIPAKQYVDNLYGSRIAASAKRLNELRENWRNPPEFVDQVPEIAAGYPNRLMPKNAVAATELKVRTLTNLYNTNPAWLQNAHHELDEAVAAAYGWEWPLSDNEILKRLFELNQHRAMPMDARPAAQKRSGQSNRRKKLV
jgi:type II restriction/modification system DNA methylase subunit YeeA